MAVNVSPLAWNVPVVYKETGYPTPYFQQMLLKWLKDTADQASADAAQAAADAAQASADAAVPQTRLINTTGALSGGGDLTADITLTVHEQQVLDAIGSTRGSILYRGASGWAILTPGAAGTKLTSGGAGADPSWV